MVSMKTNFTSISRCFVIGTMFCLFAETTAYAQLQIVEILSNSVNDDNWEWIEVQNTSGTPLDLNGFVYDDDDGNILTAGNISNANGNTVIPANGHAVLYNGSGLEFSETRFRSAWQLDASTTLIGVSSPPGLNNGGDAIGLWLNIEAYNGDVDEVAGELTGFDNAIFGIDFDEGFESPNDTSIFYSGQGDIKNGANWLVSMNGQNSAKTSVATFFESSQVNDTADIANPGLLPDGNGSGLQITEIMYNPRSEDNDWEWIEVHNGTGNALNFADTPFIFDDEGGDAIGAANVTTGSIADGEVAIIFNSDAISVENMQAAWGDLNFIGVPAFSAMNNGGDMIGLWSDFDEYIADKEAGVFNGANATVTYSDADDEGWPRDDGNGSIYLISLDADPTDGANWLLSADDDDISFNAQPAFQTMTPDHPGGDVGSPGIGPGVINPNTPGDFDGDGDLDAADLDAIAAELRANNMDAIYDLNADGSVTDADRVFWIEDLKNTYIGDSNLDLEFGSGDLVAVFQAGEYEDAIVGNSTWSEGDWNGDGDFNTSDLVAAFQSGGFEIGPRAAANAVPEPTAFMLVQLAAIGVLAARRRR